MSCTQAAEWKISFKQKSLQVSSAQFYCTSLSLQTFSINRNNRTFDCRYNLDALQPICFLRSCIASLLRCMPRAVQITELNLRMCYFPQIRSWWMCIDTTVTTPEQWRGAEFNSSINTLIHLESHYYSFPLALPTTVAFTLKAFSLLYYSCFFHCSYLLDILSSLMVCFGI